MPTPGEEPEHLEPVPPAPPVAPPDEVGGDAPADSAAAPPAPLPAAEAPAVPAPTVPAPPDSPHMPAAAEEPTPGAHWPFPFAPPREPQEGDNQVVVVNTADGASAFDVALALVWVTDGGPVDNRNEVWALASCTGCRTVAVAFQVVLVIDYVQVAAPVNAAVAVNYECDTCVTHALAVQLMASLSRQPSEQAKSELAAVWAELERASESFELLPLEQVHAQLAAAKRQILEILARDQATDAEAEEADGAGTAAADEDAATATDAEPVSESDEPDAGAAGSTASEETSPSEEEPGPAAEPEARSESEVASGDDDGTSGAANEDDPVADEEPSGDATPDVAAAVEEEPPVAVTLEDRAPGDADGTDPETRDAGASVSGAAPPAIEP